MKSVEQETADRIRGMGLVMVLLSQLAVIAAAWMWGGGFGAVVALSILLFADGTYCLVTASMLDEKGREKTAAQPAGGGVQE